MIRKFKETDTRQVMAIWLSGNEEAHSFIPNEYWHSKFFHGRKTASAGSDLCL